MEWWWVGFCQFVGGCLGLLGCEIWRLRFHFTGFEFNFFGFKFAGFVFLFKYIMCSCLIYRFYLGLFFFMWILLFFWVCGFDLLEDSVEERDFDYFNFLGNPEEHEEHVTLFFRK